MMLKALLRLGDQRGIEETGVAGAEASPGEEGDFAGLDRNPVKEEVDLSRLEFSRKKAINEPICRTFGVFFAPNPLSNFNFGRIYIWMHV